MHLGWQPLSSSPSNPTRAGAGAMRFNLAVDPFDGVNWYISKADSEPELLEASRCLLSSESQSQLNLEMNLPPSRLRHSETLMRHKSVRMRSREHGEIFKSQATER